jgi:hypothetical protein
MLSMASRLRGGDAHNNGDCMTQLAKFGSLRGKRVFITAAAPASVKRW